MAIRLEKAFGADMEALMRMQSELDIARARARAGDIEVAPFTPKLMGQQPRLI
jgi:plasmid maintenance system antidote protein VapI